MNVANVVDGLCNDSFQFISLLFDNNDVAVMNIFTQAELFCIRWSDDRKGTDTTDKPLDLGSRWHDIGNKWHEISNRWHDESKLQRK